MLVLGVVMLGEHNDARFTPLVVVGIAIQTTAFITCTFQRARDDARRVRQASAAAFSSSVIGVGTEAPGAGIAQKEPLVDHEGGGGFMRTVVGAGAEAPGGGGTSSPTGGFGGGASASAFGAGASQLQLVGKAAPGLTTWPPLTVARGRGAG